MAELSKVNVNSTDYDLKDQKSRDALVDAVDDGAKNLLRFDETSTDNNNVRFTVNADGSITATQIAARTATAIFRMRYTDNLLSQDVRGKVLSGCPSGGSDSTYKINIERRTSPYTNYGRDTGNGLLISNTITDDIPLYLYIQVYSTATLPLTFKPMICTKAEWDISQAYVPYGMTNAELTAEKTDMIDVYGRGIEIPENADLHTYTTPGVYYSPSSARTATLSNVPTNIITAGFRLVVTEESSVDGSRIRHDLYPIGTAYSSFYSENRGSTSTTYPDGWRPWVTYGPITTNPDSAALMDYMAPSAKKFYDDQQRQETEIGVVANAGAKNLIKLNPNTYTSGNVVVKLNDDGTISVSLSSGSKANTTFSRAIKTITNLRDMNLILNGCPSGGNYNSGYALYISDDSTTKEKDEGNGVLVPKKTTVTTSYLALIVRSGTAISETLTFRPMLRPAAITDPTFQPYARTNRELTVLTDEDRAALVEIVDSGAKNLMKLGFTHKSAGFQTADMTADGNGITVNGDRNTSSDVILVYDLSTNESAMSDTRYTIPEGKYVIAPTGTSSLRIQAYCHDGGGVNSERLGQASTDAVEFEYTADLKAQYPFIAFRLWSSRVSSFNNYTFYPMICTKAAWDISHAHQPYRPSWQEMWDAIQALQSGGNRVLTMQTEPEEQEER